MKAKRPIVILVGSVALIPAMWAIVGTAGKADENTAQVGKRTTTTDPLFASKPDESAPQPKLRFEQRDTLSGLQGVYVVVEGVGPEVERRGLTRKVFQTDTELQLRQYGIKILTKEEWLKLLGSPYLYISLNAHIDEEIQIAAVVVNVELRQDAFLARDPTMLCFGAITWHKSMLSGGGLDNIGQVRCIVKDYVAEFINDYLAANPKEQPKTVEQKDTKSTNN